MGKSEVSSGGVNINYNRQIVIYFFQEKALLFAIPEYKAIHKTNDVIKQIYGDVGSISHDHE